MRGLIELLRCILLLRRSAGIFQYNLGILKTIVLRAILRKALLVLFACSFFHLLILLSVFLNIFHLTQLRGLVQPHGFSFDLLSGSFSPQSLAKLIMLAIFLFASLYKTFFPSRLEERIPALAKYFS
jgi:hypothetical protein